MKKLDSYYVTQSLCGKARFISVSFGYGPRVAAENMASRLGLALEEWQLNDSMPQVKTGYRLLLNFGVPNPVNEPPAAYKVWTDCLMWLRNSIPKGVVEYNLFLAEHFFNTHPTICNTGLPLAEIPPLVSNYPDNEKPHFYNSNGPILVSFGGIETPFTNDVHRYLVTSMVLQALCKAVAVRKDARKIICCCPAHIASRLRQDADLTAVNFISPWHTEFLQWLQQASVYIVQPGLYGPFEAFRYKIPVFFTMPFSYTQVCQALEYEKNDLLGEVPFWENLKQILPCIKGDITVEEEPCFEVLASFLIRLQADTAAFDILDQWATLLLADNPIAAAKTENAYAFYYKQKQITIQPINQLKEVLL